MLDFTINEEICISCGQCASDCPSMIISMETNLPTIAADLEQFCIGCMHCVAVCSEGAVSILGYGPEEGISLKNAAVAGPKELELLIKKRRTIRNYQDENVDPALIEKLVAVASHSPSGHNDRDLLYTLVDDKGIIFDLREEAFAGLGRLIDAGKLPEGMEMFIDIMEAWKTSGKDILFRGAPHLLVVSGGIDSAAPLQDSIITLTTFELYAQACGLGTVWNGLLTLVISELVPSLKTRLGIPDNHEIGYAMGFGRPALNYERTIERKAPKINRVA
ncbi:nitroreductase family protein [Desulforhopalus sp. IMCC35007]|uniref:nitroreductase family protein n=1 Tax=Desulforhopalus sp. IMCC35007 TaxID=2569543 RepID=UPI0010ADDF6C|nr:nitroreductase family protein [Desulforhopalus sp. IMCC35007]TKB11707.1 nitroreductase [Desulforhopalus sp. IMCC35007]